MDLPACRRGQGTGRCDGPDLCGAGKILRGLGALRPPDDRVLDETEQSRQLAEAVLEGREISAFAKAFGISLADLRVHRTDAVDTPVSPQEENAHGEQASAEPAAPASADQPAADAAPAAVDTEAEVAAAARSANSASLQPTDQQEPLQYRAAPDQDDTHTRELEQATGSRTTEGQTLSAATSAPATQGQAGHHSAPADGRDRDIDAVPEPAPAPAPAGQDGETGTEVGVTGTGAVADMPAARPEPVLADPEDIPPPNPPAAAREEGTVATSKQPSAAAAEKPLVAPGPTGPKEQTPLVPVTAYADPAAYAAGHEALLAELDQHERWLTDTPSAEGAAATLADDNTLGPEGLTALLALQSTLTPAAGEQRRHLVQQLGHHIQCAQLTMAKRFFGQAARSTHTDQLRELHRMAFQGGFITFRDQTDDGEMELGQYLQHRDRQLTPQPAGAEGPAEEAPTAAEEVTTVTVEPDEDSQLPVFERPGESLMVAEEAASRLLAQAQTHLAGGSADAEPFAHIHDRPVYALVDQPGTSAASLMLGLAPVDVEGSARPVTIPGDQLTVVAPETLLMAVTTWLNASDAGGRPLLDYAPSAVAQTPVPPALFQRQPIPAEVEESAPAAAPAAPAPTTAATHAPPSGEAVTPQNPKGSVEPPAPAAPEPVAAPEPATAAAPDVTATPPGMVKTFSPPESAAVEAQAAPISTGASPVSPEAAVGSDEALQRQGGARPGPATPTVPTGQSAPTDADRVEQLTALARSVLPDLGATVEATGVLIAPRTVVITLETSGNARRDREIAGYLRTALSEAVRQHPDQGLAAFRVDFQHTSQAGQGSLGDTTGTNAVPVPRERLIAANNAAAKLFVEQLQSDPNAALARTYLTEERQLPPEVQQEWVLGYAPSDRDAASAVPTVGTSWCVPFATRASRTTNS